MIVKSLALTAVPPTFVGVVFAVVTVIRPAPGASGTIAVICVGESTENDVASVPLNFTAVVPLKFEPVITTLVSKLPNVGVKPAIVGGATLLLQFKLIVLVPPP